MKYILANTTANSFDNAVADGDYIISSTPTLPDHWERGDIRSLEGKYIIYREDEGSYIAAVKNKNYLICPKKELSLIGDIQNLLPFPVFTVMGATVVFEGYLKAVTQQ